MKAFIITILFLCHFLIPLKSNDGGVKFIDTEAYVSSEFGELYRDLGTAHKVISEGEVIDVNAKIYRKIISVISQKSFKDFKGENVYGYSIVCVSKSLCNGQLTSTWLFGLWVRVNNVPITQPLYPDGKDVMVYTTPTVVHYIETEETNPSIKIGWAKSVYDPKIIK